MQNNRPICIQVDDVHKSYASGAVKALDGINLSIERGEVFGLIGPNGAGKTSLMGSMLSLIKPEKGNIAINGLKPDDLSIRSIIGFLPERPNFDAWMTVEQFLYYHLLLSKRVVADPKVEVTESLKKVGLEGSVAQRQVRMLSRGMLQRLGLAQAFIGKPEIVFLDEPSSGMDPVGMNLVRNLLLECKEAGLTVVINSHHLDEVERVCDRVAFIRAGRIETIELLADSDKSGQNLLVRLSAGQNISETVLSQIAQMAGCIVCEQGEGFVRFLLGSREQSAKVLAGLSAQGILFEEAIIERRSLEELFGLGNNNAGAKNDQ